MRWTEDAVKSLLDRIIKSSPADDTEVIFSAQNYGLTRFAANIIHQNMSEENALISIRVAVGNKIGSYALNQMDETLLKAGVSKAIAIAKLSQTKAQFQGFAPKADIVPLSQPVFDDLTHQAGPTERADRVEILVNELAPFGFEGAGSVRNGTYTKAVATQRGQSVFQEETLYKAVTVVNRSGQVGFGTGYAESMGRKLGDFDAQALAREARLISEKNHDPSGLENGAYTVILTPVAVAELLHYLSWMSLHARAVQSGQSFLTGKKGQQVLSENLTLIDDAHDPRTLSIPFDWEGVPKQRVPMIEKGIACEMVYDSITALRDQVSSTGHALSPLRDRYYSSPLPTHLIIAPGEESIDEMIANTPHGLLITRFWYVREIHFGRATVTGMTRDGTFEIQNGKITRSLHNLRFTQSLVDAFSQILSVGNQQKLVNQFNGAFLVPALKIEKFNIVGSSTF
jgi:predicted Zn-dependent protease